MIEENDVASTLADASGAYRKSLEQALELCDWIDGEKADQIIDSACSALDNVNLTTIKTLFRLKGEHDANQPDQPMQRPDSRIPHGGAAP